MFYVLWSLDYGSTESTLIKSPIIELHNPEEPTESTVFPTECLGASRAHIGRIRGSNLARSRTDH
jgi:hypothetical protein